MTIKYFFRLFINRGNFKYGISQLVIPLDQLFGGIIDLKNV